MELFRGLLDYVRRVRLFQRNARLYLLSIVVIGLGLGVYRLLFNFYVLSQGYGESFLGTLITINSLVALVVALPAGFVSDWLGRRRSFLISGALSVLAIAGVVVWRSAAGLVTMGVLAGLANSLLWVTGPPFMMENSGEEERSYLFSFSFGLQTMSGFVGNWLGGYLPGWFAGLSGVSAESTSAYGWSLLCAAGCSALGLVSFVLLKRTEVERPSRSILEPFRYAGRNMGLLGKLLGPGFIIGLGAGLLIPFLNVFYRNDYHQPDPVIGRLFALGSLSMGVGLLLAPPLADRMGKIRLVVVTQAVSIPFLLLMGFTPWFELSAVAYLVRGALMNMSNPIYQAFVMEQVDADARAMVTSLNSMSWNFGWAFSPQLSGWLQETYGFAPVYGGTTGTYIVGTFLTYWFFLRRAAAERAERKRDRLET